MIRGIWSTRKSLHVYFGRLQSERKLSCSQLLQLRCFCGISSLITNNTLRQLNFNIFTLKWYSKGILDGDITKYLDTVQENEQERISQLFPNPRVTLNELATKFPNKVFDLQYKQTITTPKISKTKKKAPQINPWICSYLFTWPEKMKFESTALSKKQAAEKAATQAVNYLFTNKHIDKHGRPIHERTEIDRLKQGLNKPFYAEISQQSVDRVSRIWTDYENGIKNIFIETHDEAIMRTLEHHATLTKDSTIDTEDELSSNEQHSLDIDSTDHIETNQVHPIFGAQLAPSSGELRRRDRQLTDTFRRYRDEIDELPIDAYRNQITSAIENSRTTILVGAAGCGKSTRIPPLLLEKYGSKCNAIVSEPRRVAAVSLAERVASEMVEEVGSSIGYQVRLKSRPPRPPGGAVLFCTSGVLLRRLQTNPGLVGCSHVLLDEAHERDVNTDLTLLLLKKAMDLNPDLKVVVMSATLNVDVFKRYFDSPALVEVPGRTYPVEAIYLDEIQKRYKLRLEQSLKSCKREDGKPIINCVEIAEVIKSIDKHECEGGILVFLPGWAEIKFVKKLLEEHYTDDCSHLILPVHSRLSTEDQSKMFSKTLPGVRKIVLSTNIAETSVTVPDIKHVVDCGAHKENRILKTGVACLDTVCVSRAAAKQRMGRAGRVQAGQCYKMYTREKENEFDEHTTPEILRVPLDQVVLDCKSYSPNEKIEDFLSQLPEPPSGRAVRRAIEDLIDLGALTPAESLTPLGRKLSLCPLPPRLAVALLHSTVTCNVESVAYVAGGSFIASGERADIREFKRKYSETSDHAALYYIQDEFEHNKSARQPVSDLLRRDKLLHAKALTNLHLELLLNTIPLRNSEEINQINRFSSIQQLLVSALLSGCDQLVVSRKRVNTKGRLKLTSDVFTSTKERAHIASESVNYNTQRQTDGQILMYVNGKHSAARGAILINETSQVSPEMALIFAGGDIHIKESKDGDETCIMRLKKHNIEVNVPKNQADIILKAREMIWRTFQFYYERELSNLDLATEDLVFRFKMRLVKAVGRILLEADKEDLDDEYK